MDKKALVTKLVMIFIVLIVIIGFVSVKIGKEEEAKAGAKNLIGRAIDNLFDNVFEGREVGETITIANWNLQVFGDTKASNLELMQDYADIIDNYDIIFIQEIRDKDANSFDKLCALLPEYDCRISSRAGRSVSKEQYGIIYNKNIELNGIKDYNPDSIDRWERPPIRVSFASDEYRFSVYNIHVKPDDVQAELVYLENTISNDKGENLIVIGDLNADCSYYNEEKENEFDEWNWIIGNDEDTTVGSSECAYDRIIMNDDAYGEFVSRGILTDGITKEHSDHYLVWVEIEVEE